MTDRRPDLEELVGDVEPAERARLADAHALLASVEAPPDVPLHLASGPPPTHETRSRMPRLARDRGRAVALAASFAVAVFALGVLVGDRGGPGTFDVVEMAGTTSAPAARASIEVFDADSAGNWPMELTVEGLPPPESGRPYELWLTKDGSLYALCGSFLAEGDGTTTVPMNAPYKLRDFDAWVIVERGSEEVLLST